jgi:2-dehydro-3-deoxygluconokinase
VSEVLTFGETMAALHGAGPLRLGGTMELSIAGSESNVAIGLARLGHSVEWVGRVGDDELGRLVLRTLRAEGVEVRGALVDESAPTGALLFERRIGDVTRVSYYRSGSAGSAIRSSDVADRVTSELSILHVTGVTAALGPDAANTVRTCVERARAHGVAVSLDVNFRSRLWSPAAARSALRPLLAQVDILFASEDEVQIVSPEPEVDADVAARAIVAGGTPTVVVKRGGAGATAFTCDGEISVPARSVRAVDVVGAGDAFVAGYLSARLDGLQTELCLARAAVLGAFAVSRVGDWEALPSRDELGLLDAPSGTTLR